MDALIRNKIITILESNKELLKIAVRKKAKFEGWLKFELAHELEKHGMQSVAVESSCPGGKARTDITFNDGHSCYSIELKTPNTNWHIDGVDPVTKPITDNINSIIRDVGKINSPNGIMAFVLFPVPVDDHRWQYHLNSITQETNTSIDFDEDCRKI